jgi:release factor glutamine methyltransferase
MADAATALMDAARQLDAASDTPRLDAELLLAHALGLERSALLLRLRDLDTPAQFAKLVERRIAHEPVAYIIGHQHFWDLKLAVTPAVLIPRADSETLIEAALDHFKDAPPQRILDLGTGSGALLLAALSCFPEAFGIGVDASETALEVAKDNAATLGFISCAEFVLASWHNEGWSDSIGQFDLILCNPPYVETSTELAPQVRDHEPASALFAGEDGLDEYRTLIPQIPNLLAKDGAAIFELGKGQDKAVSHIAAAAGLQTTDRKDLAAIVRVLVMTA